ncbi:beta-mannosidase-like [Dreissena polymorpha]|uniref:beta-mannosidase-like n=1 Tax=Dreissena polymorpha TaxID=45954 RepID=UPI0022656EF6|nr:beta-mannosidase-like [Dreissena polymorpha]
MAIEAVQSVRRLKNHPSLLAYSGNNENELGLKGWWGVGNDQRYIDDYLTLNVATIKRLLEAEDPGRPFMLSSPSNGAETVKQGGISDFPTSNLYGDIHDYNYGRRFWDAGAYSVPRMASEYGLQSFPSAESLSSVYADADMRYGSELNAYRQHHAGGNQQMLNLIEMYMLPPNGTDERQKFSDLIYCTQIVHAVAMRTETEHYRRWQSQLTNQGEGHTMGALYWMFADIWQAPSWASIEYGGKWKMLHYFARKFFAPILISPYINNSDLKVFLVVDELPTFDRNDPLEIELELHPVITEDERPFNLFALRSWWHEALELLKTEYRSGAVPLLSLLQGTIYMRVYAWDSLEPRFTEEIPFRILKPSQQVFTASVDSLVEKAKCGSAESCFLFLHLGDPDTGPTSWLPLTTIRDTKGLEKPYLKITKVSTDTTNASTFIIDISTNRPVPFVWLEATGVKGRFSDNGFLLCERTSSVRFYAWETVSEETLRKTLTVTSLMDVYR